MPKKKLEQKDPLIRNSLNILKKYGFFIVTISASNIGKKGKIQNIKSSDKQQEVRVPKFNCEYKKKSILYTSYLFLYLSKFPEEFGEQRLDIVF